MATVHWFSAADLVGCQRVCLVVDLMFSQTISQSNDQSITLFLLTSVIAISQFANEIDGVREI